MTTPLTRTPSGQLLVEQPASAVRAYTLTDWSHLLSGSDKIVASEWDAGGKYDRMTMVSKQPQGAM